MTVLLKVVLDQLAAPTDADLAGASRELAGALVRTAPAGCEVGALVPAGTADLGVPGLSEVRHTGIGRRELAAAWQLGVTGGAAGGLVHSPTLMAPLVRHDRADTHDQVVVTIWDLQPWLHPEELPRAAALWHRAMLARVRRHADAVVVPTHGMAEELERLARLGSRTRVIAGAAPAAFAVPADAVGRRRGLQIPEAVIVVAGDAAPSSAVANGLAGVAASGTELPIVVMTVAEGQEQAIIRTARDIGIPFDRVHVCVCTDPAQRAAVLDAAVLLVAPGRRHAFPWRAVEAMTLGVPVVAAASPAHREIVWDGGRTVGAYDRDDDDAGAIGAAVAEILADTGALGRLGVLAGDRGRSFSWREAADRVWQLHAEL